MDEDDKPWHGPIYFGTAHTDYSHIEDTPLIKQIKQQVENQSHKIAIDLNGNIEPVKWSSIDENGALHYQVNGRIYPKKTIQ
jgi:hypothetical protein